MATTPRIPIVMKVWAGAAPHDFAYISKSLSSLLRSDLPDGVFLVVFDDCSTDPRLARLLQDIERQDKRLRVIRNDVNKGPNWGQEDAFSLVEAEYPDAPFFINVDDDMVYHRAWLCELLSAHDQLTSFGLTGVFTAINVPLRPSHTRLRCAGKRYLIKWKQPAFNWLIPRDIYERVGRFQDEGIAYDTVYTHWMRLRGYPVICLQPSLVQNIGVQGTYVFDRRTTSADFLGEGDGAPLPARAVQRLSHAAFRTLYAMRERSTGSLKALWPIRWGTDWVYEGYRDGQPTAFWHVTDPQEAQRAHAILRYQPSSPFALRHVQRDRRGNPVALEARWRFAPTLREARRLKDLVPPPNPKSLLRDLLEDLLPLHDAGVAHSKIRIDNVYWDCPQRRWRLAWFGVEAAVLPRSLSERDCSRYTALAPALDANARPHIRERFAARYLQTLPPEIETGSTPDLRSDLYSLAAVIFSTLSAEPVTIEETLRLREEWAHGSPDSGTRLLPAGLSEMLKSCLVRDPSRRPPAARSLLPFFD